MRNVLHKAIFAICLVAAYLAAMYKLGYRDGATKAAQRGFVETQEARFNMKIAWLVNTDFWACFSCVLSGQIQTQLVTITARRLRPKIQQQR